MNELSATMRGIASETKRSTINQNQKREVEQRNRQSIGERKKRSTGGREATTSAQQGYDSEKAPNEGYTREKNKRGQCRGIPSDGLELMGKRRASVMTCNCAMWKVENEKWGTSSPRAERE